MSLRFLTEDVREVKQAIRQAVEALDNRKFKITGINFELGIKTNSYFENDSLKLEVFVRKLTGELDKTGSIDIGGNEVV
jgi:hypothetical protein